MFLYKITGSIFFFMSFSYLLMGGMNLFYMSYYLVDLSFFTMGLMGGSVYLFLDWVTCMFLFIVYFISSMVIFYSEDYMSDDKNKEKFLYLVVLFVVSMNLMVIGPNILMILLGWDGLGLVSYCLVIFYMNESSSSAGMITVMTNRFGDSGLLLSLVFMASMGNFSFFNLSEEGLLIMGGLGLTIFMGAATKSAQMPFSAWLPAAMAAPTPVSSLVHSSTLVTAGVYLIMRLSVLYSEKCLGELLLVLSVLTMFMSGAGALLETDLKKVIALSTLSQLGVMMMILSLGMSDLAFFHLITHAMFKAMLFMCAGVSIHGLGGWQDLRSLSGLWKLSPFISMMLVLGNMSLFGVPFLSGFYSKDLILEMVYMMNSSFVILLMVVMGTMFSVIYSLRMMYYLLLKNNFMSDMNYADTNNMVYSIYFMGWNVIFLGCFMSWFYFAHPIVVFLSGSVKLINLMLIFLGVYLSWNQFHKLWISGEQSKKLTFFGEMWFLKTLSGGLFYKFQTYSLLYSKNSEVWMENLGGQGISEELDYFFMFSQKMLFGGLKYLLIVLFVIYVGLMIF